MTAYYCVTCAAVGNSAWRSSRTDHDHRRHHRPEDPSTCSFWLGEGLCPKCDKPGATR